MTSPHVLSDRPVSSLSSARRPARMRLTLVAPARGEVHRTFAEDAVAQRSGPVWRRRERVVPAGLIHAAEAEGERSLCGVLLDSLHEFGRSRHPFERYDDSRRCSVCHTAANQH